MVDGDRLEVLPSSEVWDHEDPIEPLGDLAEVLEPFVAANAAFDLAVQ